jgi:hypothetical protein
MGSIGYITNGPTEATRASQKDTATVDRAELFSKSSHPKTASIPLSTPFEHSDARDLLEHLSVSLKDMADTLGFVSVGCEVAHNDVGYYMRATAATLATQTKTLAAVADCAMELLHQEWYPQSGDRVAKQLSTMAKCNEQAI